MLRHVYAVFHIYDDNFEYSEELKQIFSKVSYAETYVNTNFIYKELELSSNLHTYKLDEKFSVEIRLLKIDNNPRNKE